MAPNNERAQEATCTLEQQTNTDKNAIAAGVGDYLAKDKFKKDYSCFKATAYTDPKLDGYIATNVAMVDESNY
jgi:hypothetical protein